MRSRVLHLFSRLPLLRRFTSAPQTSKIGFVGLGSMGKPMALNLICGGYDVMVFDLNKSAMDELSKAGAKAAESPAEIAQQVSFVVSMLPAYDHVKAVYFGNDGLIPNMKAKQAFFVDCSTIGPIGANEIINDVTSRGHRMIDAPVSGGVPGATAGSLTFMVGGSSADIKAAEEVLKKMGQRVYHCGAAGSGQAVKVCNNLILGTSMIGVAEGYRLANALGVDMELFNEVVNTSSGRCWTSECYNPVPGVMENVPSSRDYQGGFSVNMMAKDLSLSLGAAKAANANIPMTAEVLKFYQQVSEKGFGNSDIGSVYKHCK